MIKYWSEKNSYGSLREFSFHEEKNILEVVCYQSNYYNYSDLHIEPYGGPYLGIGSKVGKDIIGIDIVIDKIISYVQDKNKNLFIKMGAHKL
jgi:hypothetical protein